MLSRLISLVVVATLAFASNGWALKKTRGVPIGGMGTGYVGYDATLGNFYASGKTPPAGADGRAGDVKGADYTRKPSSSGFYFYADGQAVEKATTTDEDAKCPVYFANYAATKGVTFKLTAFGPFNPGDNPENFKLATSPLAFFDIAATNGNAAAVDVAAAMEFANGTLLGGAASGTIDGTQAITFAGTNDNAYLAVDCDGTTPTFSAGAIGTFTTAGTLANADGNLVAAKCSIPAGATVHFKFTLSWWRKYETTTTSRYSNWDGKENYWYHNNFANSKEASAFGRSKFDAVRTGIISFVDRTMASNFPEWYKDRLLNNTYPLIHNAQVTKDGRLAFWEGKYGIIGTLDQGEHAAVFYTFNWPEVQWKELGYWKSTTRQGQNIGQIHHDFNIGISNFFQNQDRVAARFICPLGDNDNKDYWWFPATETWADLNCMFIFKAYELMLATGNIDSMKAYLPAIKQTAQRLVTQCGSGSKLPLDCHSTYDICPSEASTSCTKTPEYNAGLAVATYEVVAEIAKFCGDDSTAATFRQYFTTAKDECKQKYGTSGTFATGKDYSEGDIAGYSWANYFCLEPTMDSAFIASACTKLRSWYSGKTSIREKLGKWGFYTYDHWGGVEIATGNSTQALQIHNWDWTYYYKDSPELVFWQTLRSEIAEKDDYASYMTAPTVWRSYFQMLGYLIDNANQRLWIRPRIPTEMTGKITNALLLNPKAMGTLNYDENLSGDRTQKIIVAYDAPVTIKELVLKNNTGVDAPFVVVAGVSTHTVKVEGSGYEKNIRVTLAAPIQIGPEGVTIEVYNKPVAIAGARGPSLIFPFAIGNFRLDANQPIRFSVGTAGPVTMELLSLNGAKIGTIMQKQVSAGANSFVWNGKTVDGRPVGTVFAVLRLTSPNGSLTKTVFAGR